LKNSLNKINGFDIKELPFSLERVGDLMFYEGPLMSILKDNLGNAYLQDWVDSDEKNNRWLIYQISLSQLNDYITNKTSHFSLVNNPTNDIVFVVDKNSKGIIEKCLVCSPNRLPYEYLPDTNIEFEKEDSRGLKNIIEFFELDSLIKKTDSKVFDILKEAKKSNEELINIHIKSSNRKVSYGKIYSSILGKILLNYSNLNSATALNIYDNTAKIPKEDRPRRKKGELNNIKQLGELEFVYAKAASFSVFLRPISKQTELFDNQTSSEKITQTIFNLFEASKDLDKLNEYKSTLNEGMLNSYNTFLKEIKEDDISINVQYANPENELIIKDSFSSSSAKTILNNLNSLEFENTKDIKIKGNFKALDSISKTFKIESFDGDVYSGKFSKQLEQGIFKFNLQDYYQVTVQINETKKSGTKKMTEKYIIVSCLELEK
jgi:hypothetical protein